MKRKRRKSQFEVPAIVPGATGPIALTEPALYNPDAIKVIGYGPDGYEEQKLSDLSGIEALKAKWPVVWVDIDGLGNFPLVQQVGEYFKLDRLVLEDISDTSHQPKMEVYDNFLFVILKNGMYEDCFITEQISMVLMEKVVLTFQERPGDSFNQLRERIRGGKGRIRKFGPDYLAYAVMDAVVESYYPILSTMKKRLDAIEDIFVESTGRHVIRQIHDVKNELLYLHSAIWPIHNLTLSMAHDDLPGITKSTSHFLRDCQDQAKRITELSEFYRLIASDLMNTYLAFGDNKANEVMKVLTMVTTIFIPLSFIASLYGMNFDRSSPYNMPELGMRYAYPVVLAVMAVIAGVTLWMFKRKGWFMHGE